MTHHPELVSAFARVLQAPRPDVLEALSSEIGRLVPHPAAAILTGACARAPIKKTGPAALTAPLTAIEVYEMLADATIGERDARWGGRDRRVLALPSSVEAAGGAGLVLLRPEGAPPADPDAARKASLLWELVSAALVDRATDPDPWVVRSNLDAAAARRAALADLREEHGTTLARLLGVLRARDLDDRRARGAATEITSTALINARRGIVLDRDLTAQGSVVAFDALRDEVTGILRHREVRADFVKPDSDVLLPKDVAHSAQVVSRGAVVALLEQPGVTRLRLGWTLDHTHLGISARSDGTDPLDPHHPAVTLLHDRLTPIGGKLALSNEPHWGTTLEANLPLAMEPPRDPDLLADLTAREIEVLATLTEGLSNRRISQRLTLSEHTVRFHVHNILTKLAVRTRGEAAALARTAGLV